MSRQAMIIDLVRCVGCGACAVACEEEWRLPAGVHRNWVRPLLPTASGGERAQRRQGEPVHAHDVGLCNHCGQASCIEACPTGATYRDGKGRVVVDAGVCIGCGHCVEACPYGARTLRDDVGRVEKCDLCAPRVDAGLQPACVETCPAGARIFGDLDRPDSAVARAVAGGGLRRLETPQVSIDPHVYYRADERVIARILAEHPPRAARLSGGLAGGALRVVRGGFFGLLGLALVGEAAALAHQLLRRRGSVPEGGGDRVRRHGGATRFLHWFNALVWLLMLATGIAMLGGSTHRLLPAGGGDALLGLFGSRGVTAHLHIGVGVLWTAVLLAFGVFGFRGHLLPFLRHLRLDATDRAWLVVRARRVLRRSDEELPPQDKFNAGQKLFGLVVALGSAALVVSGLVMLGAAGAPARWAVVVHFAGMAAVLLGLVVHLFMSVALPSERPVLRSMFHGWIPADHARAHSPLWWERVRGDAEPREERPDRPGEQRLDRPGEPR